MNLHAASIRNVLMAAGWLLAASAQAAGPALPGPRDLREEAALVQRWREPLVVMFSLPDCAYCPDVRDNYLAPMAKAAAREAGPVVREIDITSRQPLKGFNGEPTTGSEIAKHYRVRATPTVLILDDKGELLAEPLVGAGMAGFYGAYLDRALEEARGKLVARGRKGA